MKTIGKILTGLGVCALLAGSGCGIYYGIKYNDLKNTKQESNSGVVNTIKELQTTISDLNKEKATLLNQVDSLNSQLATLSLQNTTLNNQIKSLQETISSLTTEIDNNKEQLSLLQSEITTLNTQIQEKNNQIETLQETIDTLNNQIQRLNLQISIYKEELKVFDEFNKLSVSFVYRDDYTGKDEVSSVQFVNNGEKIDLSKVVIPNIEGYQFLGWTKNGDDIIDNISDEVITEDTIYYAKFNSMNGTFTYGNDIEIVIENGELIHAKQNGTDFVSNFNKIKDCHYIGSMIAGLGLEIQYDKSDYTWYGLITVNVDDTTEFAFVRQ